MTVDATATEQDNIEEEINKARDGYMETKSEDKNLEAIRLY